MTEYRFAPIKPEDLLQIWAMIGSRIRWMDEKGIRQWNVTRYQEAYPISYYEEAIRLGQMYGLYDDEKGLVAALNLPEHDRRWNDGEDALYVHNLVTALNAQGAGAALLKHCAAMAAEQGKRYLRLDCAAGNAALNAYYENLGFLPAGRCIDGLYEGVKRQLPLNTKE